MACATPADLARIGLHAVQTRATTRCAPVTVSRAGKAPGL